MARPLQPADAATVARIRKAEAHLKAARDLLASSGSPNALARVRAAIASTGGAIRHANRRAFRTEQES